MLLVGCCEQHFLPALVRGSGIWAWKWVPPPQSPAAGTLLGQEEACDASIVQCTDALAPLHACIGRRCSVCQSARHARTPRVSCAYGAFQQRVRCACHGGQGGWCEGAGAREREGRKEREEN